jgi:hypothetical protein
LFFHLKKQAATGTAHATGPGFRPRSAHHLLPAPFRAPRLHTLSLRDVADLRTPRAATDFDSRLAQTAVQEEARIQLDEMGRRCRALGVLLYATFACGALVSPFAARISRPSIKRPRVPAHVVTCDSSNVVPVRWENEVSNIDPIDVQILQTQLQAVRNLPRVIDDVLIDGSPREDPLLDDENREPSFRRLFTHATWARYTGRPAHQRWIRTLQQWRYSLISKAILPLVLFIFCWAVGVATVLPMVAPQVAARASQMWIPLSLQGTAIGLLLVFRTNNAYLRLAEAREQWGRLLMLVREIATKVSVALPYDVTCDACRYLCAFTWSLRDKLRDGETRDDILSLILGKEEAAWVTSQRSRPLAVLSRLRRLVYSEYQSNSLDSQLFYFLETDSKRHVGSNAGSPR